MKKLPPLVAYSVLRLLAFLVPLAIMWFFFPIMRELWYLTVIFAALIGVSISIIFLRKPLSDASAEIYDRREARTGTRPNAAAQDADAEDAVLDQAPTEVSSDETPREG
jgi:fatty acid desaturase